MPQNMAGTQFLSEQVLLTTLADYPDAKRALVLRLRELNRPTGGYAHV